MYWINVSGLKEKLRSGEFHDRDAVPYIIAQAILINLSFFGEPLSPITSTATIVGGTLAIFFGTWFVFKKHDPNSRSSFLKKYISLGWVVTIHCYLILTPVFIFLAVLMNSLGIGRVVLEVIPPVGVITFYILYYGLLGKYMR